MLKQFMIGSAFILLANMSVASECMEPLKTHNTQEPFSPTNPLLIGSFYQMGHHLYQTLKKHQIRCWLDGGGLLGLIRHQGMIPWDDDLDFCIHPEDSAKLSNPAFLADLRAVGLELVDFWFGAKVQPIKDHPLGMHQNYGKYSWKSPFIDLFFTIKTKKNGKNAFLFQNLKARTWWPNAFYYVDELYENNALTQEVQFGPIKLPVPFKILPYLKRQYGNHCLSECYMEHDHIYEKAIKKVIVPLINPSVAQYEFWDELPSIN